MVKEILKPVLPELNEEFYKRIGLEAKNIKDLKKQIEGKLKEDLENLIKNKILMI